jgi:hypothetical protein
VNTDFLDVVIGIMFVWLLLSVVLSAMHEGLGLLTHLRSKYLWLGIGKVLNSSQALLPRRMLDVAVTLPFRGTLDVRPRNGDSSPSATKAAQWWTERPARKTADDAGATNLRRDNQALYAGIAARVTELAKPGRLSKLTSVTAEAFSGAVVDVASHVHRQDLLDAAAALDWPDDRRNALAQQLGDVAWSEDLTLERVLTFAGSSLSTTDLDALYQCAKQIVTPRDVMALFRDNPAVVDAIRRSSLAVAATDRIAATRQVIETHFDRGMADLSRWYRRQSRKVLVVLAIPLVLVAHANAIDLYGRLQHDRALRDALAGATSGALSNDLSALCDNSQPPVTTAEPLAAADAKLNCVRNVIDSATEFRVGLAWQDIKEAHGATGAAARLEWADVGPYVGDALFDDWGFLGRAITIAALMFGAQFWFDALRRLVGFRRTLSGTAAGSGTT